MAEERKLERKQEKHDKNPGRGAPREQRPAGNPVAPGEREMKEKRGEEERKRKEQPRAGR